MFSIEGVNKSICNIWEIITQEYKEKFIERFESLVLVKREYFFFVVVWKFVVFPPISFQQPLYRAVESIKVRCFARYLHEKKVKLIDFTWSGWDYQVYIVSRSGYLGIWREIRFKDNLEQNISRQQRPGTCSSFAMNWLCELGSNLLITVTLLRPKLCNLVSKGEKFNWMNIFSHPSVTQSKLSLRVSPSSHLVIWGEPTKIPSSVFTTLHGTFFLMSFFHLFSLFYRLSTSTQMLVIKYLFKGIGTDLGGIWREGIPLCLLPFQSLVLPLKPIWMSGPSICPPRFCRGWILCCS